MRSASGRLQRPHQLSLDPFCSDRSRRSGLSQRHFSCLLIQRLCGARRTVCCWGYLTFVENERLTFDPWNREVIEPLKRLLCAAAGIRQVQDDLPLLRLA